MIDAFHWGIIPVLLQLGPLQIRWYGLCFAFAFLAGYQVVAWMFRRENKPEEDLDRLFITMFLGTVIGARLGHCLFYEPDYFLSNPLEILKIWRGGLSSHGATTGIIIALYLYSRKRPEQPYMWVLSRISMVCALGGCFVRIGNFFNSEIVGKPSNLPWAVVFTRLDRIPRHPAMLYESLSYLILFFILTYVYLRTNPLKNPKLIFGLCFIIMFSSRFFIEFTKEPQEDFERSLPLDMGQLLSIPMVALGLYLLIKYFRENRKVA